MWDINHWPHFGVVLWALFSFFLAHSGLYYVSGPTILERETEGFTREERKRVKVRELTITIQYLKALHIPFWRGSLNSSLWVTSCTVRSSISHITCGTHLIRKLFLSLPFCSVVSNLLPVAVLSWLFWLLFCGWICWLYLCCPDCFGFCCFVLNQLAVAALAWLSWLLFCCLESVGCGCVVLTVSALYFLESVAYGCCRDVSTLFCCLESFLWGCVLRHQSFILSESADERFLPQRLRVQNSGIVGSWEA